MVSYSVYGAAVYSFFDFAIGTSEVTQKRRVAVLFRDVLLASVVRLACVPGGHERVKKDGTWAT